MGEGIGLLVDDAELVSRPIQTSGGELEIDDALVDGAPVLAETRRDLLARRRSRRAARSIHQHAGGSRREAVPERFRGHGIFPRESRFTAVMAISPFLSQALPGANAARSPPPAGTTFEDADGYRVVLFQGSWEPSRR